MRNKLIDVPLNLVAIQKLERIVNTGHLNHIFTTWCDVAKDSKRRKEYFKV